MPATRPATGPLPAPTRTTGPLPGAGAKKQSGMILPPPPKQTGSVPAIARSTAHLPPPPLRDASGRLPLPRTSPARPPVPPAVPEETFPQEPDALDPLPPESQETIPIPIAPRTPLPTPDDKPLFGYDASEKPSASVGATGIPKVPDLPPELMEPEENGEETTAPASSSTDLAELREQFELLTQERDQALAELEVARGHGGTASDDQLAQDLATAIRERDEARMEVIVLRSRIDAAEQTQRDTEAMASQLEELSHVIDERDSVRRDYASLREQFENLKLDRSQLDSGEETEKLRAEVAQLQEQLAGRGPAAGASAGGAASGDIAALQEELRQAKEETSLAHRGLALSQKALQETRDALREATEGSSASKGNLDEAKKERAGLLRQNQLLQGQVEQLTRDLSAAKAKLAAKGV
jgi:hypothetical protein